MLKSFLLFLGSFSLAFLILIISVFRVAEIKYVLSEAPTPPPVLTDTLKDLSIEYKLTSPGTIQPDSAVWPIKALRDKVWVSLTVNPAKKAEIYLLLADKRLGNAKILFEGNKADLGLSVLTKAEKYLESAKFEERKAKSLGMDTSEFLKKYIMATLKHREIMEQILTFAPEDAKPLIIKTENYPKTLYGEARNNLLEAGLSTPENPFN